MTENYTTTAIHNAVDSIQAGKTILTPTDTIWGLSADATNEKAIDKVFEIKQRPSNKSCIVLCSSIAMAKKYAQLSTFVEQKFLESNAPTTIILPYISGLAQNAIAADNTIAIRIPRFAFLQKIIETLEKPIISTSANISGENTAQYFYEIHPTIINNVDYVVPLFQENTTPQNPSTILKWLNDDSFLTIR